MRRTQRTACWTRRRAPFESFTKRYRKETIYDRQLIYRSERIYWFPLLIRASNESHIPLFGSGGVDLCSIHICARIRETIRTGGDIVG